MKYKSHFLACLIIAAGGAATLSALAEVPKLLHYQGRILSGTSGFEGAGQFKFALLNSAATQVYWRNAPDQNGDGQPDAAVSLTLARGLFSVFLGDSSLPNMAPLLPGVLENEAVFLRVWFSDGTKAFAALSPDQRLVPVAYALMAATVPDASITTAKLAAGALNATNLTGTLQAAQIPTLDAAKITAGRFDAARLPQTLVDQTTQLSSQIATMRGQIDDILARLTGLTSGTVTLPAGLTLVSETANDSVLGSQGFQAFMSFPSSPWENGASENSPAARRSHAAIWTGEELIIWGGDLPTGSPSGLGGVYRPDQDSWHQVSPVDAPAARSRHSALWTGQEMIVWGGYAGGYLNTGGRFNPALQVWTPTSTAAVPSGHDGHAAAWTGKYMIIWGGRDAAGFLETGAAYDPRLDQWTPTPTANVPAARTGASVVWTGTALLVWGGEGAAGPLGNGGRLLVNASGAPSSWSALATANAPSARSGHTAVWTGKEMIVVGGEIGSRAIASGAAYNPTTRRWRALSVAGNPLARSLATAVWTGSEVLVFGGRGDGQLLGALQRLNPQPAYHFYRKP